MTRSKAGTKKGGTWAATFPRQFAQREVRYQVRARWDRSVEESRRIESVDDLVTIAVRRSDEKGQHLASAPIGDDNAELGVSGPELGAGATIGPASFALEEDPDRVQILDTVKNRVVTYDGQGKQIARTPLVADNFHGTDIIVQPTSGARYLLGQAGGDERVIRWFGNEQRIFDLGVDSASCCATLWTDGAPDVFLHDGEELKPLISIVDGEERVLTQEERRRHRADAKVLTINVEEGEIVIGDTCNFSWGTAQRSCGRTRTEHIRIVAPQISDADFVLDRSGHMWLSAGYIDEERVYERLIRLDLRARTAAATVVETIMPFDSTRSLAPLDDGVAVMSGDGKAVRVTKYADL